MGDFSEYPDWEGRYEKDLIGRSCLVLDENLLYQDLILRQPNEFGQMVDMVVKVPETWIDLDELKVLLPHPTYNIGGLYPDEWSEPLFNRRRFPNPTFVEYVIQDFLFASGGKLLFFRFSVIALVFHPFFSELQRSYGSLQFVWK